MKHTYRTNGTCSVLIDFELDANNIVHDVEYTGGCHGNLQAIGILVEGMPARDVIEKLGGIRCGFKKTSCGDQLAIALSEALKKKG